MRFVGWPLGSQGHATLVLGTSRVVPKPLATYYFVGSTGLLNKYLHTISCSQDLRVTSDFILTESHIIVGTARK